MTAMPERLAVVSGVAEAPLQIRTLAEGEEARWDGFVARCPEATFFHRAGWRRVVEDVLGHRTHYLYVESAGHIEGVLPLGLVRSALFGHALLSVPFCVYGGVAATTVRARDALVACARRLADELNVRTLELRHRTPVNETWPRRDLYVTFRKEISNDPDTNLKAVPRKQRAMIRKGVEAGLVAERDADCRRFYQAYSESVRQLGTPVLSRRYYQSLFDEFGDDCEVLTVTRNGRLVSSVMSFYFRDEVLPYYGGGTAEARACKGNDFMYWELMRLAAARGVRIFDYGRSKKGSGSYRFKTHWGFESTPLHYEVYLPRGGTMPEINPLNPRYRLFISLWKHLPLPVSQRLGPLIARQLG